MPLGTFEGDPVVKTAIKVTAAGDGLSAALEVDPVVIARDEEVTLVMRTTCSQVIFEGKKEDGLTRKHTLKCTEVAIVDDALVEAILASEAKRIEDLRGVQKLEDSVDGESGDEPDPF